MATAIPFINQNPLTPVTPPPDSMTFPKPTVIPTPAHLKRKPDQAGLEDAEEHPPCHMPQPAQGQHPFLPGQVPPLDPRYVAMVQRVAAFYQHRSQAVASIQQQRCQAWANVQRQKCQEMVQAATLVVAWYIRDRISRRRRKAKRKFRSGLQEKGTRVHKVPKGEVVRRWVLDVPDAVATPDTQSHQKLADPDEADFDVDKETTPDKDSKLFEMADTLIKTQYRKVELPLFGALDLDDSDDGSEAEDAREDEDMHDDMEDEEDLLDDDDDDVYDDLDDGEEPAGSQVVGGGTGPASAQDASSLIDS